MDRQTVVLIGSIELTVPQQVKVELLAALRDDMRQEKHVRVREYWPEFGVVQDGDPTVPIPVYKVVGRILADRLDLFGFDSDSTLAMINGAIEAGRALGALGIIVSEEITSLGSLDAAKWVDRLRAATDDPATDNAGYYTRRWLLNLIDGFSFHRKLRAILLAFPEEEVVFDGTGPAGPPGEEITIWNSSDAAHALRHKASAFAPIVVLTEGKTDSEFLGAALAVLYPHLTDLIRFFDYERKAEGGVGGLVHMIRAFAAAGISNRVVAILDNDTAAAEALRNIDTESFAPEIQILRYPDLDLAKEYPTLGPPAQRSAGEALVLADVNGLAGSIELYLGRDILTREDGTLQPVQWTSLSQAMHQYQGEITNKPGIHKKFRAKYKMALAGPKEVYGEDWDGLQSILDSIRWAACSAYQTETD